MSNQMAMSMRKDDTPQSAKIAFNMNNAQNFNNFTNTALLEGKAKDLERKDQFDQQISQAQFQSDEAQRLENEQKKAQKRQMIGTIAQVIGTVGGLALSGGNPLGGMIGGGLGQMLGGVLDKSAPADYNAVLQGLGHTIGGFTQYHTSAMDRDVSEGMFQDLQHVETPEDLEKIRLQYLMFVMGKIKKWQPLYSSFGNSIIPKPIEMPINANVG